MRTVEFDYELPLELIAQTPLEPRDGSRLMVVDRRSGEIAHRHFYALPHFLRPGDLLAHNESRVISARLFACKWMVSVDPVKSNDNVTEQASFPQKIMSLNSHHSVKRKCHRGVRLLSSVLRVWPAP